MRDPYTVLGVSRTADEAEVKKAYRKLAKALHPDRNTSDPKAKDKFAELNSAYEIVGDATKRAQFDRGEIDADGKPKFQGFEGFGGGGPGAAGRDGFEGFSFGFGSGGPFGKAGRGGAAPGGDDIFSQLFGEAMRGAGRSQRAAPRRGEDVSATLTVTIEDIVAGERKRIALPTGREVEVQIPKDVRDGKVVRLRGLGESGAEPGDALLTIQIAPHERFTVEGNDLRLRQPVDLEDAILGGKVRVATPTGAVDVNIPARTSSGRTLRLRGKGLPGRNGVGDLLVSIEIKLPDVIDEDLIDYAQKRRAAKVS